jgi:hypothetical protein
MEPASDIEGIGQLEYCTRETTAKTMRSASASCCWRLAGRLGKGHGVVTARTVQYHFARHNKGDKV